MLKRFFIPLVLSCAFFISAEAQLYSGKDIELCNEKFNFAAAGNLSSKPIGEIIVEVGKSFIGTDYLTSGIETEGEEELVINLTGLDCTTFLENVLVFSRLIQKNDTSFESYINELTYLRYRDGIINQYPSRLHYFSDWIYNNEQKNIIKDITKEIGGKEINFTLNFMSAHPQFYKHLSSNPEFIPVIRDQENVISGRKYYYIPKNETVKAEKNINNGDLIAFTTSVKGLDVGHVGIAVKQNGRIHLLHAPQKDEKVQITKKPLPDYIKGIKRHTGIIVLRPVE